MTRKQKLELRASEIRTELSALADKSDLSEEDKTKIGELRSEYGTVETQIQAATIAGDEPLTTEQRSEDRDLAVLIAGADMGHIFESVLEHRSTDGQTAELQQHFSLAPNQFPSHCSAGAVPSSIGP